MKRLLFLITINFIFYNFAADERQRAEQEDKSPLQKQINEQNYELYKNYLKRCAEAKGHVLEYLPRELTNIVHEYHCIPHKQWQENNRLLLKYAKNGNIDKMRELLELGDEIDLNFKYNVGVTALMWAAANGQKDIAELLINAGANVNAMNIFDLGHTALTYAVLRGHQGTVELLIQKGADINAENKCHYTPLMIAVMAGSDKIAAILKKKGGKYNEIHDFKNKNVQKKIEKL